ncbi:MAG: hypothetical protein FWD86_03740 [Firmicutes bacterium]|nr:hypothetical protein [Bacillota bacterium]
MENERLTIQNCTEADFNAFINALKQNKALQFKSHKPSTDAIKQDRYAFSCDYDNISIVFEPRSLCAIITAPDYLLSLLRQDFDKVKAFLKTGVHQNRHQTQLDILHLQDQNKAKKQDVAIQKSKPNNQSSLPNQQNNLPSAANKNHQKQQKYQPKKQENKPQSKNLEPESNQKTGQEGLSADLNLKQNKQEKANKDTLKKQAEAERAKAQAEQRQNQQKQKEQQRLKREGEKESRQQKQLQQDQAKVQAEKRNKEADKKQKEHQKRQKEQLKKLKKLFVYSFDFLTEQSQKDFAIGTTDIFNDYVRLSDYSVLLSPPFRGLERLIFDLQSAKNISVKMIGQAYEKDENGKYILKSGYYKRINSIVYAEVMASLYTEYFEKRNFYAHSDITGDSLSRVITDKSQVKAIFLKLVELIEYNAKKLKEIGFSLPALAILSEDE